MSDHNRASQGRLARFCETGKLCLFLKRLFGARTVIRADGLDERLKRDIGIAGGIHDGGLDGSARPDPRGDHYRRLLRRGYPLG
ncbi:hypothetical protein HPDFL43_17925 [Hoeflea phototrophica DFL-43]|jgi:hypothetical protein|uniref:Uncharacterized protein n=1 Tax=Hoeflea phototrophica (strain DSM 17068 / NCIMB 14078 / DFL-43) TaxID=411684 RepID=A9DG53_HOEPD|nr:hypothetical protein [Hoeflea phototrophica]EDQ31721.1 hypothetical protein HPDFL43_17925 [Hoeflea phototrophica DFL-43]